MESFTRKLNGNGLPQDDVRCIEHPTLLRAETIERLVLVPCGGILQCYPSKLYP